MEYHSYYFDKFNVMASGSVYETAGNTKEYHLMLIPGYNGDSFEQQLKNIYGAFEQINQLEISRGTSIIFKRYFLSDAANQYSRLTEMEDPENAYAVSVVQQLPLNGSKIALWVYMASELDTVKKDKYLVADHNGYRHIWSTQVHGKGNCPDEQTTDIFQTLENTYLEEECSIEDHCIRTWLFVNNVDVNYGGVVEARKEFFNLHGLTRDTHFISSTGIEGRNNNPLSTVIADAYAIKGLREEQLSFLKASSFMNPTYEYGVTFERGTAVDYGDRRHIYISGTASINNKGEIVHPGDVEKQAQRAMQNIDALLAEACATAKDIAQMIIYLRDIGDYDVAECFFKTNYPHVPRIIVLAPVCRPGWLIEIECIAIAHQQNLHFHNF
jgi:enamine deaminase RidA (YjgF/YER057c/UK114 family)